MYADAVNQNLTLGRYLRSFQFYTDPPDNLLGVDEPTITLSPEHIHDILSLSPQLTRISALKFPDDGIDYRWILKHSLLISWSSFEAIAHAAGSVLESLDDIFIKADKPQTLQCPSVFGNFSVLRSLRCSISTRFQVVKDSISAHHLSTLECLRIWACHSSFLELLSCLKCVLKFIRSLVELANLFKLECFARFSNPQRSREISIVSKNILEDTWFKNSELTNRFRRHAPLRFVSKYDMSDIVSRWSEFYFNHITCMSLCCS
jgi:hypothetical protein